MEVVEGEQAGDPLVLHEPLEGLGAGQLDRPLQPGPVQLHDQPHDLLGDLGRGRVAGGADLAKQLLDPRPHHAEVTPLLRHPATPG